MATFQSIKNAHLSHTVSTEEKVLNPSISHFFSGFKRVFSSKSNLDLFRNGPVASLIVWSCDDYISEDLRNHNLNAFELQAPSKLGSCYVLASTSIFTHILGTAIQKPYLANTGLYLIQALLTTQFLTIVSKRSIQRSRPDGSNKRSFPPDIHR